MKLCDIFAVMETYLDHLVEAKESRKTNVNRIYTFLNAFLDDADDGANPIYSKKEDFLRKVYRGDEPLPVECAQFYLAHLSSMAFEDFISDVADSVIQNMVDELAKYDEYLMVTKFGEEFTELMGRVLYNIVSFKESNTIRYADFTVDGKVRIGSNTYNLAPELAVPEEKQTSEGKYIDALLEVYEQDAGVEIKTLDDLSKLHKRYQAHFKVQRSYYFSALSALRQVRDIFADSSKEFEALKKETLEGIQDTLLEPHKNGMDRLSDTLKVVTFLHYGKAYLGRENNGLIGTSEKKGIIHMLVNDGKVEWVVDYDTDI